MTDLVKFVLSMFGCYCLVVVAVIWTRVHYTTWRTERKRVYRLQQLTSPIKDVNDGDLES